jgi:hypothetical protein
MSPKMKDMTGLMLVLIILTSSLWVIHDPSRESPRGFGAQDISSVDSGALPVGRNPDRNGEMKYLLLEDFESGSLDTNGWVNHTGTGTNYLVYFERLRNELLREAGLPYTEMEKQGVMLPVVEAVCNYKKAAEYDTKILVPVRDYIVLPIAQEIVKEAHYEAGRPDTYDKQSVFFITTAQFAFVAGVNGVMIREKTATNFYMGMFFAESLIMTETGSVTGAIQIAGTDAVTQIPFFITTCDYTLIGEELYAASAYLAREPLMLGTLKAQDYTKFLILVFIIAGSVLSTLHLTFLINAFPEK